MKGLLQVLSLAVIIVVVTGKECTEEELNAAQIKFKDCMDEKKASLLQTEDEDEVQDLICTGLKDLSTGCKEPVTQFAICRGREFVDNLVAIHLNAMSEVLGPLYPSVSLSLCPVFHTPAPEVVHVHPVHDQQPVQDVQDDPEPEYQPVTGAAAAYRISLLTVLISCVKLLLTV